MRAVRRVCEREGVKKRERRIEKERKRERELRALSFALSFARSLSLLTRITAHSLSSCSCIALSISLSLSLTISLSFSLLLVGVVGRLLHMVLVLFMQHMRHMLHAYWCNLAFVCSCFYYIIRILLFSKFYKFLSAVARQIKAQRKGGKGAGEKLFLYFLDLLMYYICA